MKFLLHIILLLSCIASVCQADWDELKLWYDEPASEWVESLPVGNGRLLATNQGGVYREVIQMNEDTIWSGGARITDNPEGAEYLPVVRQLIFEGKYAEAQKICQEKMMLPHHAHGVHTYQTLGNLILNFEYNRPSAEVEDYRRELDLDRAVSSVSYKLDGVTYTRELFSSVVDNCLVVRLSCDSADGMYLDAVFERPNVTVRHEGKNLLVIAGTATDKGNDQSGGVAYEAQIKILNENGSISPIKDGLRIAGSHQVEIRIVAATDYHGQNPHTECVGQMEALLSRDFSGLLSDHLEEHRRLFRRVDLQFEHKYSMQGIGMVMFEQMTTDELQLAYRQGLEVPGLLEIYFQLGRYILITGSRPGTQAINLWGKWVSTIDPAYNADYHTNINIPMNYWPALATNLAECNEPFFDLIDELRPNGRNSARVTYDAGGFVAHHATDAWRITGAVGRPTHGMWVLTPAWGAHQMWKHYLYTGDQEYLTSKSWPVMKEAAEFFIDYLVEDPRTGFLVSGPSTSPENTFRYARGKSASISMAPTMDMQIISDLFANCISAGEELGMDTEFTDTLAEMKSRLQPMRIGSDGRLMEWMMEHEEPRPGHKHCSHLWGLCEGSLIHPQETTELAQAARKSLDFRVEHGSAITPVFRGNTAWIIRSFVRLWDGNEAYKHLRYMIGSSSTRNLFAVSGQGLSRNMWETDANLGCTAAIADMLVQSHAGTLYLLPALPDVLPEGAVRGLRTEGGFEVDIEWADGKLKKATIHSLDGNDCIIANGERKVALATESDCSYSFDTQLNKF
ncbi:MAG: glycoside hydrolase N-terminal domain-containing protein [Puniceicoccaceae bacterium]